MTKPAERKLVDMWRLVRAAAKDNKRLSTGDIAVLIALCDRYGSKFNPDMPPIAGQSLLGSMASLSKRAAFDSTHRLMEAGYIEVIEPGSGTRGTKWRLNFSRGEADFITKPDSASGEAEFTDAVKHSSPLAPPSGEAEFIESLPTVSGLPAGIQEGGNPGPDAPLVAAAVAAPLRAGRDGFEDFWSVYPRKFQRAKAKAAWDALTSDQQAAAVVGAVAYADYCRESDRAPQYVKQPNNWLSGECWLEDPSAGFAAKVAKPDRAKRSAKPADAPANDNAPVRIVGGRTDLPRGEHLVDIVGVDYAEQDNGTGEVTVTLQPQAGEPRSATYFAWHPADDEREAGQRTSRSFLKATGGDPGLSKNPDPVGQRVWAIVSGNTFEYRAA